MALTAVKQYQRLECAGLWQDTADAQRRDVIVSIGEASLVMRDPRNEQVVAHWSLPAITRQGHGLPAIYQPGSLTDERLELSDPDMIAALDTVHKAIVAARPQPGRLRGAIVLFCGILVGGGVVGWLPDALREHTASVVPPSVRAEVGQMAFDDVTRLTGAPCTEPQAQAALAGLSARLAGEGAPAPILLVLREGLVAPGQLPGDIILLPPDYIMRQDGPQALAGAIAAEIAMTPQTDPLLPILHHAGLRATFALLTTGELPAEALHGYGEAFLASRSAITPVQDGLPEPLMPDADWVALQGICDL